MFKCLPLLTACCAVACTIMGCTQAGQNATASSGSTDPSYWRQKAVNDRAICRANVRQMQLSGAPGDAVARAVQDCNDVVNSDLSHGNGNTLSDKILQMDKEALADLRSGRVEEGIGLFKQIDANGPEIIANVEQMAPRGAVVSMQNSPAQNMRMLEAGGSLRELARAQRIIGTYYEDKGQDAVAASWYEKANATMATQGGKDILASDLLGFMYAYGRGVPKRAMALFGGSDAGFMGLQGKKETALAWLRRAGNLPRRMQDATPAYIDKVADEQAKVALGMVVAILMSSGPMPHGNGSGWGCAFTMPGPSNNVHIGLTGDSCWR